jgi:hypothetical protein
MEVTCSSETSLDFQWTTWYYIPEDRTLNRITVGRGVFHVVHVIPNAEYTKIAGEIMMTLPLNITYMYIHVPVEQFVMMICFRD